METIQKEFKNFKLEYDGIFTITLADNKQVKAFLSLETLFKMILIEGLHEEDITLHLDNCGPIEFRGVTLLSDVFDKGNGNYSFLTSERAEHLQENGLILVDFTLKEVDSPKKRIVSIQLSKD